MTSLTFERSNGEASTLGRAARRSCLFGGILIVAASLGVRHASAEAEPAPSDFIGPRLLQEPAIPHDQRRSYRLIAQREAKRLGIPYALIDAVISVESGYDPLASGRDGEVGLMQIMPQTARLLGFRGTPQALSDPEVNIGFGATYLAEARRLAGADLCTTVMKYRAGHQETRFSQRSVDYCLRVRRHLASLDVPVTGEVPPATFGFGQDVTRMGVAIGSVAAARRHATGHKLRSRVGWGGYTARVNALEARARHISLER